jgi:pimeloyl-ACP methyl ester carboxylesterase
MPLDQNTGVYYELHGSGAPLMIGLPLMASHTALFGPASQAMLDGYLDALTDRYQVMLIDYPSIGNSRDIAPAELTADRVCNDLLGVASAAGFKRFAYWGFSWSGAVGLQLASRTDRLTALVIGGWPPLDGPYANILAAARKKLPQPEASSLKVLRSPAQYAQWIHYYESMLAWPERDAVSRFDMPRLVYFGAEGDLVEAGYPVTIASNIRRNRATLQALGWTVHEVPGQGHAGMAMPEHTVPLVRAFLDRQLAAPGTAA